MQINNIGILKSGKAKMHFAFICLSSRGVFQSNTVQSGAQIRIDIILYAKVPLSWFVLGRLSFPKIRINFK